MPAACGCAADAATLQPCVKLAVHPHSQQYISQTFSDLLAEGLVQEGQPLQITVSLRMPSGTPGNAAEGAASHFQVAIVNPEGHQILQQQLPYGQTDTTAPAAGLGTYSLCLNNAGNAEITVDIALFDLVEQGNSETAASGAIGDRSQSQLGPVREQVLWLQGLLRELQAEQRAMHERLDRHYATNLDTKHRTLYRSLAEVVALLAPSLLQVVVIQWFFRRHSGTISRHLSAQALVQDPHAEVGERQRPVWWSARQTRASAGTASAAAGSHGSFPGGGCPQTMAILMALRSRCLTVPHPTATSTEAAAGGPVAACRSWPRSQRRRRPLGRAAAWDAPRLALPQLAATACAQSAASQSWGYALFSDQVHMASNTYGLAGGSGRGSKRPRVS